jgi:hypothetical protein
VKNLENQEISAERTSVCQPEALTVFRLAIAESDRAPEIALTLHHSGREANQKTLVALFTKAQQHRLIASHDPAALAARYNQF